MKLGIVGTAFRGKNSDFDEILTKELYLNKIYSKYVEEVYKIFTLEGWFNEYCLN